MTTLIERLLSQVGPEEPRRLLHLTFQSGPRPCRPAERAAVVAGRAYWLAGRKLHFNEFEPGDIQFAFVSGYEAEVTDMTTARDAIIKAGASGRC